MYSRVFCRQCRKEKTLFSTRAEAQSVLTQYRRDTAGKGKRRGRNGRIPKRVYWCGACQGWHLTHRANPDTAVKRNPVPYKRVSWEYSPD